MRATCPKKTHNSLSDRRTLDLMSSTSHEGTHYVVFSSLPLIRDYSAKHLRQYIVLDVSILNLQAKFNTHTERQVKIV